MTGLVYAPDALGAADRGSPALWRLHRAALLREQTPLVLAPVLASAPAGPPSARLRALLAGCLLVDFPVGAAWDVARLRRLAPEIDLVTAAVVLAALAARAVVVSTEPEPYQKAASRLGVHLSIVTLID